MSLLRGRDLQIFYKSQRPFAQQILTVPSFLPFQSSMRIHATDDDEHYMHVQACFLSRDEIGAFE
jgi:hypothetical protein